MNLKTGDHIFQSQTSIDRQGQRWLTIKRRRVLAVDGDRIAVAGFEQMTVPVDQVITSYDWQRLGGLMGMDTTLSTDALRGYRTSMSLNEGAA